MLEYTEYTKILIGLLAILNPIGVVPIFVSMTTDLTTKQRKQTARTVVFSVFVILMVSLFFGEFLLSFFGITINSFRVGGGILVMLMAISMLQAKISPEKQTREEAEEAQDAEANESIGVVPLSMPLLAGPGAISAVIVYAHRGSGLNHHLLVALDILLVTGIIALVFMLIPWMTSHISRTGMNIITRIMGLVLAALAIEFIANGLKGLFPPLA